MGRCKFIKNPEKILIEISYILKILIRRYYAGAEGIGFF